MAPTASTIVREQMSASDDRQCMSFRRHSPTEAIARHSLSQGLGVSSRRGRARRMKAPRPDAPRSANRGDGPRGAGCWARGPPRYPGARARRRDAVHYDYDRIVEKRRALEQWEAHVAEIVGITPTTTAGNVVKLGRARRR